MNGDERPSLYDGLGEFHDLFMAAPWERLRPHVRDAFADLPDDAVIGELGAGTGMGTRVIAGQSRAAIWAVEPNLVMRSALTARVADTVDLASRVTVVAGSVPEDLNTLPDTLDGVVCAHMLGHLDQPARSALFGWLDRHLTEHGVGLVTFQDTTTTTADDTTAAHAAGSVAQAEDQSASSGFTESRVVGQYEYRVHYLESAHASQFVSRYEVWFGDSLVRAARFAGTWHVLGVDDLAHDLAGTGLVLDVVGDGVATISRRARDSNAG